MITVNVSGALPQKAYFRVLAGNVYDALYGADRLEVDVKEMNSSATAATNMQAAADTMVRGTITDTALTPTSTAFECSDIIEADADTFIGREVIVRSGSRQWEATAITDYSLVSGRGRFTVNAFPSGLAPANGDTIIIV